jgi:iron complex transport system ATP-binding protein
MVENADIILNIRSLKIGYSSGSRENIIMENISASARRGEIISVIGRNGVGKSTLLRTLAGLQSSLDGYVSYKTRSLSEYSRKEFAQVAGYISTEIVRVANMRVYDLVSLGRYPHTNWMGKINREDHKIIMNSIEMTSMLHCWDKYLSELSDGERQKAMISRMLAQDADIMIMDEPTAFLDVGSRYEIFNIMHRLSNLNGKTILFSTHDLQMATSQSDKIWLLLDDSLVEGAPEDLMMNGAFEKLFGSSLIRFNPADATFSIRQTKKGSVYVKGGGPARYWTEKALKRSGYAISNDEDTPYIELPSGESGEWIIISEDASDKFDSIYEAINRLKQYSI